MSPTNGTHFCYAASASYELAFHVNTLMPTVSGDKQQIAKKKFIGNDSIHVVWSEAQRPYRQTTIKSSFNFVHLVVYPLPSGLFKVTVLRKRDKVGVLLIKLGRFLWSSSRWHGSFKRNSTLSRASHYH